ncbi:MAG: BrnT family toxin [Spirochaetes bacterium]|nr:BrnT family toxin [Spirochaetota bacterium]
MKIFNWNPDKNDQLILERNVSFEEIVMAINEGNVVDVYDHPNQQQYPNQKIYAVQIDNYIYLVPFVKNDDEIFLKTIIPSRKTTKKYLGGNNE